MSEPRGQAAQPGSWLQAGADPYRNVQFAEHAGPRGRAAQPYGWLNDSPAYPAADPHRIAQDGPLYLGGRAGQPASWTPKPSSSWTLAAHQDAKAKE